MAYDIIAEGQVWTVYGNRNAAIKDALSLGVDAEIVDENGDMIHVFAGGEWTEG